MSETEHGAAPDPPVEGAAVVPEAPPDDPVADVLSGLATEVAGLGRRMDELARLGDRREQLVDRLHADNQRLRAGELGQVQAPILRELIRTYDLVVRLGAEGGSGGGDLELVRRRLLDGLESSGVTPLEPAAGEAFDASRQVAAERVDASQQELDMTVARTLRIGFVQDGERVLRPADVAVHRYVSAPPATVTDPADAEP
jgi:molecular chaperone GrpE (heat shock protein)